MSGAKGFKKAPFSEAEAALELLGVNGAELSRRLGYSENFIAGCRPSGEIPLVASIAIRALLDQAGKTTSLAVPSPRVPRFLVCTVIKGTDDAAAIERMLQMAGQRTWKIDLGDKS